MRQNLPQFSINAYAVARTFEDGGGDTTGMPFIS